MYPQSHFGREWTHLLRATICAMPTADESNHSAAGTLHGHRTDGHTTAYTALA